jgi:hypothetical protein
MSKSAVTEAAPAVADFNSSEDRSSNFLPTDEKYRLTGEMPSEAEHDPRAVREEHRQERVDKEKQRSTVKEGDSVTPPEKVPSGKEGDSATPGDADTAAASAAAPPQKKTAATSESRWQKITRENRELRDRLQKLETGQPQRETQQASQPVTETKPKVVPKPKIDDLDPKTNQPKFKSYAEFEEAKDTWNRQEAIREFQETSAKTQREQQQTQAEQIIEKTVNERVTKAREAYADYDDAMSAVLAEKNEFGQDALFYTKGSPIDGFFLDSDRGHDVLYYIAKHFDQAKHIFARDARGNYLLNPIRQLRELAKIEGQLPAAKNERGPAAGQSSSSVKPITQASRPPHQVSGTGTVAKDAVEQALEDGDFETYQRTQNAKDLARLKKK